MAKKQVKDSKGLNEKQRQFCREYIIDFNATQAGIRAGYSKKTAYSQAFDLLKKPEIQAEVSVLIEKRARRTEITADRVLQELALIGFADMQHYVEIDEYGSAKLIPFDDERMPEGASRAVSAIKETRRIMGSGEGDGNEVIMEIKQEYKHHDKVKALELLGKNLGIWIDKTELSGPEGGPITFSNPERAAKLQHLLTLAMERAGKK